MGDKEKNFWGKKNIKNPLEVRFDPLQSFFENGREVGFRVHVVPSRQYRPRDHKLPSKIAPLEKKSTSQKQKSILSKLVDGETKSIPIAGDNTIIGSILDKPDYHNLSKYDGLAIINKFSPFEIKLDGQSADGVALVVFPSKYIDNIEESKEILHIMKPMVTAIRFLLRDSEFSKKLNSSLIFFNIGPSSGASLSHLHAQAYVLPRNSGMISYAFQRAYHENNPCLVCKMGLLDEVTDHLGQTHQLKERTIWEDDNIRMITPNAPIRALGLRILLKKHISWIGEMEENVMKSVADALSIGHKIMLKLSFFGGRNRSDRMIGFRQSIDMHQDFHMFIDLLPSIPFGGAEIIDSLSITTISAENLANEYQKLLKEI